MGNLKEIRTRIASVSSTQKITSAMKLVSAAKLRRAQNAIIGLRPYATKLDEILGSLSETVDNKDELPFLSAREPKNVVLVVITANRGLCGTFNANVIKETHRVIREQYALQQKEGNLSIVCIGRKGYEQLGKHYQIMHYNDLLIDNPTFHDLTVITNQLLEDFLQQKIDKIDIVYNHFINPATQRIEVAHFLPVQNLDTDSAETKNHDFIFEPSKKELLTELIPKILRIKMFKSLIDSIASEHGARMTSMAKATDNAADMLKELKLKYNNARQSSITTELIEIISGANALDA
jgi:F-type H+-transporting ATPase subunit gamma